ncbi:uncharacterized protein LOC126580957 [Anopheles aquasalis]|uniref:Uncharacterized protein n=1 Tax=Anopheles aquasalis TaxID=42839 RepID=T1E807_ANOAQ|nr:uncharacterized protein LOC126580957 [Anopheles aquasalis]
MAEENKQTPEAPAAEAAPDAAPEAEKEVGEEEVALESSDAESEVEAVPQISPFERLKQFLAETNNFLNQYDDLVQGREKHKSIYLRTVNELRERLVVLLHRYILHTMVKEDFLYKHIICCGEEAEALNTEEFDEHYEAVHKDADKAISLPELAIIQQYSDSVQTYIEQGKAMNNDLIFSLKRLLRKSNSVLAGHLG